VEKLKRKLFIGTSGWVYGYWNEIFYPKSLPSKNKLKYFSQHFKTTDSQLSFLFAVSVVLIYMF